MKELMIHVERIVRPIRADASKLRMRRELLDHLQASFEQERARGLDEAAAVPEAKRRLGEPNDLRRELQASVSRLERLSVTPFPKAVPIGLLWLGALLPAVLPFVPVPDSLIPRAPRHAQASLAGGVVVLELSCLLWCVSISGMFRPRVRWARAFCIGVAAFVIQFVAMSLLTFALSGHAIPDHPADAAAANLLLPAFFAFGGIASILAKRPYKEWLELEIADV